MNDAFRDVVAATNIGATGSARARSGAVADLEDFQVVVRQARLAAEEGTIRIMHEHRESQTAGRFIDRLQFVRLA